MEAALASTRAMSQIKALSGYDFTSQYADFLKNATAFSSSVPPVGWVWGEV